MTDCCLFFPLAMQLEIVLSVGTLTGHCSEITIVMLNHS